MSQGLTATFQSNLVQNPAQGGRDFNIRFSVPTNSIIGSVIANSGENSMQTHVF